MRPIPLPNATIEKGKLLGWEALVIAAPDGDLTGDIRPVEALVGVIGNEKEGFHPELNVLIQIEEEDRSILEKHGGRFWITFVGHIVPFSVTCFNPDEDQVDSD